MVSWDTRMLSSSGYRIFSHPETCSGDQSKISLLATMFCNSPVLAASVDGLAEQSHRDVTTDSEWTYVACRRRVRSHATTVPPSNGAIPRSSAPQKVPPVSLG